LLLDKTKFPASLAGDVSAEKAAFMADSQVPWGVNALGGEAVDNAANLARCKSLRRQLPVYGRLAYPVRAEATKHVLPGRKSLGRPTA